MEYAKAFKVSVGWLLTGVTGQEILEVTRRVMVVGEVAAGVWQEEDTWDERKFDDIPTVPGRYEHLEQLAYLVRGPSMDLVRIFDGDFVIVVRYFEARVAYVEGDIVLVTRRNGSLTERTVKILHLIEDGFELTPRSSDPRFQKPIVIRSGDEDASDSSTEITGLVIASHRRF
jgi:SOS-response transcriptional repressor LexA